MSTGVLERLTSPNTDGGVLAQVVAVVVVAVVVGWLLRRERALVLLTAGLAVCVLGLLGLRALH
jgi:hypothetical protein